MVGKTYGPEDAWPRHPHKDLNVQAQKARSLGWSAKRKNSHGGFVIVCPAKQCRVRFDSTPKNPTREARKADRTIRLCGHSSGHGDGLQGAIEALDKAERLICAADELLTAEEKFCEAALQNAETLIQGAIECEEKARAFLRGAGFEGTTEDRVEANASSIGDYAEKSLKVAREEMVPLYKDKPPHPNVAQAWNRYVELRERLERVRGKMGRQER